MPVAPLTLTASASNLKRLTSIRTVLILALLGGVAYLQNVTASDLINPTHLTIPAIFALVNMLTYWRLQYPWPVTDFEYFGQLLFDVVGLSIILYLSGGASNPFISYFLVPITVAAALLPRAYAWCLAATAIAAYSLLLFHYRPLPVLQMQGSGHAYHSSGVSLHILGMWMTFALSAVLITHFVVLMASALRARERQQASQREQKLRDEQLVAIATLAAGTAHELGTPLSTVCILLDEIAATHSEDTALLEDIDLLRQQVGHCRKTLSGLVATADVHSHYHRHADSFNTCMQRIINHWQLLRPEVPLANKLDADTEQLRLMVDPPLEQAIANLLNNAADAAQTGIEITAHREQDQIVLCIGDDGPGIPVELADEIGKAFVSTKGGGMGLGLFLSHATIERAGGSIVLRNRPGGGTVAEVRLPQYSGEQA